ncbi:MAG TPA: hypothetical protein VLY24_12290 [Bryobacteraceae bacterium]|nr:hypothetical protein [Bryobacteraceae bacterium]
MSNPGPPKKLESFVAALIPPACQEHILGDLAERYRGNWQYLREALCVLPLLLLSRMRRAIDPQLFVIEASAAYLTFFAVAWQFYGNTFFRYQSALLRLAVPALATVGIVLLFDVYWRDSDSKRSFCVTDYLHWNARAQSSAAAAGPVVLFQIILAVSQGLHRPMAVLILGGLASVLLITMLRIALVPGSLGQVQQALECRAVDPVRMSPEEIRTAAVKMYRRGQAARNMLLIVVWLPAATWAREMWHSSSFVSGLGCGISLAGLLYGVYVMQKAFSSGGRLAPDSSPEICVEFCRRNLESRRDFLRRIWLQVIGPMLAGTLLVMMAEPETLVLWQRLPWLLGAAVFYSAVGWLAQRRVPVFQRQIDALGPLRNR